ncbi:MAG: phage tail tape measure protein [Proteobacteria bacterium]|jgi:TP901 family phage tail tape measure protein|nr:phage tail tape measure protein [Pseudomonadota bacterium]
MAELGLSVVIGAAAGGAFAALDKLRERFGRIGKPLDALESKNKALGATIQRQAGTLAPQALGRTARGYEEVGSAIDKVKAKQSSLLAKWVGPAAIGASIGKSIHSAINYEDTISDIGIAAELSDAQAEKLGAVAREAAQKTHQGRNEMLAAMKTLATGGLGERAGEFAEILGKTATSQRVDMAELSNVLVVLHETLGIETTDGIKEAFGRMAKGGKGLVDMGSIIKVMPDLAGALKQRGVTGQDAVGEVVAALEASRKSFGSTDKAVVAMNAWIKNMGTPAIIKAYADAGVDYEASMKAMASKGMNAYQASVELAQALLAKKGSQFADQWKKAEGDNNEEAQMALMEAFGLRDIFASPQAVSHMMAMRQNIDEYKKLKNSLGGAEAQGTIDADFARRSKTASAQFAQFKNTMGDLGVTIGSALLPSINSLMGSLVPVVSSFASWAEKNPELIANVIKLGVGLLAAQKGFSLFGGKGSVIVKDLGLLTRGFGIARTAVVFLSRALLMNPIGIAVTLIAGAAYLIYKNWEPIKKFFGGIWEKVKATFSGGIGSVCKAILNWSPIGLFYKAFASVLGWFGVDLPKNFTEFGANLIGGLVDGIKAKFTAAKDAIVGFGKSIKGWFTDTLGISSPSKVFAGFGDNIAQGAAIGIDRSGDLASRASGNMARDAAAAAAGRRLAGAAGRDASQGCGGVNVTFSPTITLTSGGAGVKEQVSEAIKLSLRELEQMMARVAARQARTAY